MSVIQIDFEKKERAIELPDGSVLDIPERTKANDDKIQAVLKKREELKEYEFLAKILEAMFGKEGLKKIIPSEKTANLDFLTAVYLTSVNAFYEDKNEAEQEELHRKIDRIEPITEKLGALSPLVSKSL